MWTAMVHHQPISVLKQLDNALNAVKIVIAMDKENAIAIKISVEEEVGDYAIPQLIVYSQLVVI